MQLLLLFYFSVLYLGHAEKQGVHKMWQKQIDKPRPFRPVTILLKDGNEIEGLFKDAGASSNQRGWYSYGVLIDWQDVAGWKYKSTFSKFLSF
jgi:hypothetical protein